MLTYSSIFGHYVSDARKWKLCRLIEISCNKEENVNWNTNGYKLDSGCAGFGLQSCQNFSTIVNFGHFRSTQNPISLTKMVRVKFKLLDELRNILFSH